MNSRDFEPIYRLDSATIQALELLDAAGAPQISAGTFGTVAKRIGVAFATPTAADSIDVTTDAIGLTTVVFAGTETTPALAAATINTAVGATIAWANPYDPLNSLVICSQIAGNASSLVLANNVGTPLAAILGGGYAGSTETGVTSAPIVQPGAFGGRNCWLIQADGMGALSSCAFALKRTADFGDVDMDGIFSHYDGVTQTGSPGVAIAFALDPARGTTYFAGAYQDFTTGGMLTAISRNDNTNLALGAGTVLGYTMTLSAQVRGAYQATYPELSASIEAQTSPNNGQVARVMGAAGAAAPAYGAPWTTGSPPYPEARHFGLGLFTTTRSIPFPINIAVTALSIRRP